MRGAMFFRMSIFHYECLDVVVVVKSESSHENGFIFIKVNKFHACMQISALVCYFFGHEDGEKII